MSEKVTEDFLSRMARKLRGETSDDELEPLVVEYNGILFKIRRRLHFRIQDWINSAIEQDNSGRALLLARRAAASIISISLDGGDTYARVEELFPLNDNKIIVDLSKQAAAIMTADMIIDRMFDSADFSNDHGSEIIERICVARSEADTTDELKRLAAAQRKADAQAQVLRNTSVSTEAIKGEGKNESKSAVQLDSDDREELFGEFDPLSEAGLSGH